MNILFCIVIGFYKKLIPLSIEDSIENLSIRLKEGSVLLDGLEVVGRFPLSIFLTSQKILTLMSLNSNSETISELFEMLLELMCKWSTIQAVMLIYQ